MTVYEYLQKVRTVHVENPDWRLGQSYFNVLTEVRPGLAERVRGRAVDPFNFVFRIADFLAFFSDHWDEAAS